MNTELQKKFQNRYIFQFFKQFKKDIYAWKVCNVEYFLQSSSGSYIIQVKDTLWIQAALKKLR